MRSSDENPMTLGERYSVAIETSNLRLVERRGDADLIIAAGLIADPLASAIYRLRTEYDSVRAEHRRAEDRMRASEAKAARQRDDPSVGPQRPGCEPRTAAQKGAEIRKRAESEALMAHVLILSQLASLREAKERFGGFAIQESAAGKKRRSAAEVLHLAGRALEVHLAPNCPHCAGRGFNGAPQLGEVQTQCRPCKGQGHRRDWIGKTDADRNFAGLLMMQLDALLHEAQRDIRTGLNLVERGKAKIAEGMAAP